MTRKISSSATSFYRYFTGLFFAGFMALFTLMLFLSLVRGELNLISLFFIAVILSFLFINARLMYSLTNVWIDDEFIYLSRGSREVKLNLSNVIEVDQGLFGHLSRTEYAYIILDQETALGKKIYFTPPFRLFGFSVHPIVEELDAIVQKAKWEAGLPRSQK